MKTLYDWQQVDVDLFKKHKVLFNASETGCGKSLVAVEAGRQVGAGTVLIVAPKSLRPEWVKTVTGQGLELHVIENTKAGRDALARLSFGAEGWFIVGSEFLRTIRFDKTVKFDYIIVDEVHTMVGRGSEGLASLDALNAEYKMVLSATPLYNKLENMWGLVKWLYPDMDFWQPDGAYFERHRGRVDDESLSKFTMVTANSNVGRKLSLLKPKYFWQFAELFFRIEEDYFKGLVITGEHIRGEVVSLLPAYVRHLKRGACCVAHPAGFATWLEPRRVEVDVAMTRAQRAQYDALVGENVLFMQGKPHFVELSMTRALREVQAGLGELMFDEAGEIVFDTGCKSGKIDWLVGALQGDLADEQVVVWTSSQRFARVVVDRLGRAGVAAAEWSGQVDMSSRDSIRAGFGSGEVRVIVGVIAAGTGLDFMQVASNVVYLDVGTNPALFYQSMGRTDRRGQVAGVVEYYLFSEGTKERENAGKMWKKLGLLDRVLAK